jgi:hypothetical protein
MGSGDGRPGVTSRMPPVLTRSQLGFVVAVLVAGCGADALSTRPDGGASEQDSGPAARQDAAVPDGAVPATPDENDARFGAAACYDFEDNNDDGHVDCEESACTRQPICCVGSSDAACCTPLPSTVLVPASCAPGSTVAACFPIATVFGLPEPVLRDGAIVPNGNDRFDSGLVLRAIVDPRVERVTLAAGVLAAASCTGCVDHVAFGITSAPQVLGATSLVDPDVALIVSNASQEVRLLVGDRLAWIADLAGVRGALPMDAPIPFSLEAAPDGEIVARVAGAVVARATYRPRGPAHVVIWGRSTNPGPLDPQASIVELDVTTDVCDSPASAQRRDAPILPDDVTPSLWAGVARVTAPSVATWVDGMGAPQGAMAYELDGRIHVAGRISDGRYRTSTDPRLATNAIIRPETDPWRLGGVGDPELVRGEDEWTVYYTAIDAEGVRRVARATGVPGHLWQFPTHQIVRGPGTEAELEGTTVGFDSPTYLAPSGSETQGYLAMRRHALVRDPETGEPAPTTEIVLFRVEPDLSVADAAAPAGVFLRSETGVGTEAARFVHRAGGPASRFDADEVAGPSLVRYRGVLRMYFAGRRSTRWVIGVLVSQDGLYWRLANDGAPILAGRGAGYDALSVADPEPVVEEDQMFFYHSASDGVSWSIGLATHAVPEVMP